MNTRERCMNILHYKDADRMPAVHFGYWQELLDEWAEEGHISGEIAKGAIHDASAAQRELDKIIGWDCNWHNLVGAKNGLLPMFESKLLEVLPDGSHRVQTGKGVIEKIKPGIASIPSEDDYLLKDREAFETMFKPKMQFSPARVNLDYFRTFNDTRPKDVPVGLMLGSVLGQVRDMTTVIGLSYLSYDEDEELFADIRASIVKAVSTDAPYKTLDFPAVFEKSYKRVEDAEKYLTRLRASGIDANYLDDDILGKDAHTVVSTVHDIGEFIKCI